MSKYIRIIDRKNYVLINNHDNLVRQKKTDKIFYVKQFYFDFDGLSTDTNTRLFNEINILSQLKHPAIVKLIGFCPSFFHGKRKPGIFLEYMPNKTLRDVIILSKKGKAPFWNDTKKLINLYGIASGMKYAHSKNIIHRDLKPENVLEDENYYPKICDFNLSKSKTSDLLLGGSKIVGTPMYMAPEIMEENDVYSFAIDVFSFAITAYEIMTNEDLYKRIKNRFDLFKNVISGYRPEFTTDIPERYKNLIECCWAERPEKRPTFDQIVDELRNSEAYITSEIDVNEYHNYIESIDKFILKLSEKEEEEDNEEEEEKYKDESFTNNFDLIDSKKDDEKPLILNVKCFNLKKFKQKEKIGDGGFANVYRIFYKKKNYTFAAKIIQREIFDRLKNRHFAICLTREVNILSKLSHNSVVKFIGYSPIDFNDRFQPVIVTEFISNGSLESILEKEREGFEIPFFDDTKKLIIIYGIAFSMMYLHSLNIIHRDLKPGNILIDEYLFPKLTDFGFSKEVLMNIKQTSTIFGTSAFIAPEIWDDNNYSKKSDVYAFAVLVYEILCEIIPFCDLNEFQIACLISDGKRPTIKSGIPKCYKDLIESCWSQEIDKRPTFTEIVENLQNNPEFIISKSIDKKQFLKYIQILNSKKYIDMKTTKVFKKYSLEALYKKHKSQHLINQNEKLLFNIDSYKKVENISKEGLCKVIKIADKKSKIIYSAKTLTCKVTFTKNEIENISKESRILSQLNHPAIQKFIGYSFVNFKHHSKPMIINEYLSNNLTLEDVLSDERKGIRNDNWNPTKKLIVIYGIASAMKYLHSNDVHHYDLKPRSIYLDENLYPKICEIGFWTKFKNSQSVSKQSTLGLIAELPVYSAPEVLQSYEYTEKSDVYSFGLIVYEIITKSFPFSEIKSISELRNEVVVNEKRPSFRKPIQLCYYELIEMCWSQNPEIRPSFEEIVKKLDLKTNFISQNVDKNEYDKYVELIKGH